MEKEKLSEGLPPMGITPILCVNHAADALAFYQKAFDAKLIASIPAPDQQRLLHGRLQAFDTTFVIMDEFPELSGANGGFRSPAFMSGTSVTLHVQVDNAKQVWSRVVEAGAEVVVPLAMQFWGELYGRLKDPFGHEWTIAQMVDHLAGHEVAEAAQAALGSPV